MSEVQDARVLVAACLIAVVAVALPTSALRADTWSSAGSMLPGTLVQKVKVPSS